MAKKKRQNRQITFSPKSLLDQWKTAAACEIWAFAKRINPLRGKLSASNLYIDADSLSQALILEGFVPNAAQWKQASVPMNRRVSAKPHPVMVYGKWKTVKTGSKLVPSLGVPLRDVSYYGGQTIGRNGFFGVKRDVPTAYGLTDSGNALPAYSLSIPELLCDENLSEVQRILKESFDSVMKRRRAYS